jgi:hypothetical protein
VKSKKHFLISLVRFPDLLAPFSARIVLSLFFYTKGVMPGEESAHNVLGGDSCGIERSVIVGNRYEAVSC